MPTPDYYAILGVASDANPEAIKAAARLRARETHPDLGGDAAAFRAVRDAYDVLKDPARRSRYDAERARARASVAWPTDASVAERFHELFRFGSVEQEPD